MPTDSDSNSAPATPESTHSSDFVSTESYRWADMKTLEWANGTRDLVLEDLIVDGAFDPDPSGPPASSSFYEVKPEQPLAPPPSQHLQSLPTQVSQPSIVNLAKQKCSELPIVIRGVAQTGAKSRVETQIRLTLDLASALPTPLAADGSPDPDSYDRVGSWKWLRLPAGTSTKKRPRKEGKIDPLHGETLFLSSEVYCASPPHTRVYSCTSCQQRETKRTARKQAQRVRPPRDDDDDGVATISDRDKVVQFTCPDLLEFGTGSVPLPLRITCYCRHHREKLGFRVVFILRDEDGRVVGQGTTPPIMITDDHKTAGNGRHHNTTADEDEHDHSAAAAQGPPTASKRRRAAESEEAPSDVTRARRRVHPYDRSQAAGSNHRTSLSGQSFSPFTTAPPSPVLSAERSPLSGSSSFGDMPGLMFPDGIDTLMAASPAAPSATQLTIPHQLSLFTTSLTSAHSHPPARPVIHRLIPCSGPTHGGIEITILGANFHQGMELSCVFGDVVASSVQRWSENTLVCILPPRACAGVVSVSFKGVPEEEEMSSPGRMFSYVDENDRALMELALQVVGLRMTGRIEEAKNVAMRIVNDSASSAPSAPANGGNVLASTATALDPRSLLLAHGLGDFQTMLVGFLSALDVKKPHSLAARAELSLRTPTGQTLLHFAAALDLGLLVACLIERGIDLDARDVNGFTALHFAAMNGRSECATLLVQAGADAGVVDARGRTASEVGTIHLNLGQDESGEEGDDEAFGDESDDVSTWSRQRIHSARSSISSSSSVAEWPVSEAEWPLDYDERTLTQPDEDPHLVTDQEPTTPTLLVSKWLQKNVIDNIPQLHLPAIPGMPSMHLPGMPAMPNMPTMLLPGFPTMPTYTWMADEKQRLYQYAPWRASWEKWIVTQQQRAPDAKVPTYLASAAPPTEQAVEDEDGDPPAEHTYPPSRQSRRPSYGDTRVSEGEVNAYAFQVQKPQKPQKDRMLMLFWGPVLLIVLAAGLYHTIPLAFRQLGRAVQDYLPMARIGHLQDAPMVP